MTTPELDFDHSLLGKEHHAGPFQVTRELIDGFCNTLGETNPLYLDEEAARSAGYRHGAGTQLPLHALRP